jgi:hypothetical protein
MARMVVLYFEDNEAAEKVVDGFQRGDYSHLQVPMEFTNIGVVGMYAIPTKFCDCKVLQRGYHIVRGEKFGWRLHRECGNWPTRGYNVSRNLIPEEQRAQIMHSDVVAFSNFRDDRYTPQPNFHRIGSEPQA